MDREIRDAIRKIIEYNWEIEKEDYEEHIATEGFQPVHVYHDLRLVREWLQDHPVVSLDGWTCDTCGIPVNGQTDDQGIPRIRGDSVRHTGD